MFIDDYTPSVASTMAGADEEQLVDFIMVENAKVAMLNKLSEKRIEGMCGWSHPNDCHNSRLIKMLKEHIDKGDMVDVMNIAAMIHARSEMYGEETVSA